MKLNKWIALILTVACLIAAVPFASAATLTAQPGSTVEYTVSLAESAVIAGFKINVEFDTDVFSLAADADGEYLVSRGSFSTKGTMMANVAANGCSVLWYHTANVTASGTLFTLTLNVAADAPSGTYPVSVSYSAEDTIDVSYTEIPITLTETPSLVIDGEEEPPVSTDTAVITVSDASVLTGDTVSIPVHISGNTGFSGFALQVTPIDGMSLVSIKKGALLQEHESGTLMVNPTSRIVNWSDSEDITEDGELLVLEYQIPETCPAGTYFPSLGLKNNAALNFVNSDSKAVAVEFASGTLTVVDYVLGDADDDGEITGSDAILMARHIVDYETLSGKAFKAADIDKDGEITAADCVKVARYLVGLITEL